MGEWRMGSERFHSSLLPFFHSPSPALFPQWPGWALSDAGGGPGRAQSLLAQAQLLRFLLQVRIDNRSARSEECVPEPRHEGEYGDPSPDDHGQIDFSLHMVDLSVRWAPVYGQKACEILL